jgi:hypothetical protein
MQALPTELVKEIWGTPTAFATIFKAPNISGTE